jgi:hypothetical protein
VWGLHPGLPPTGIRQQYVTNRQPHLTWYGCCDCDSRGNQGSVAEGRQGAHHLPTWGRDVGGVGQLPVGAQALPGERVGAGAAFRTPAGHLPPSRSGATVTLTAVRGRQLGPWDALQSHAASPKCSHWEFGWLSLLKPAMQIIKRPASCCPTEPEISAARIQNKYYFALAGCAGVAVYDLHQQDRCTHESPCESTITSSAPAPSSSAPSFLCPMFAAQAQSQRTVPHSIPFPPFSPAKPLPSPYLSSPLPTHTSAHSGTHTHTQPAHVHLQLGRKAQSAAQRMALHRVHLPADLAAVQRPQQRLFAQHKLRACV